MKTNRGTDWLRRRTTGDGSYLLAN